jgi:hypothetical protein
MVEKSQNPYQTLKDFHPLVPLRFSTRPSFRWLPKTAVLLNPFQIQFTGSNR